MVQNIIKLITSVSLVILSSCNSYSLLDNYYQGKDGFSRLSVNASKVFINFEHGRLVNGVIITNGETCYFSPDTLRPIKNKLKHVKKVINKSQQ